MRSNRWLLTTIATTVLVSGTIVAANAAVDIYGLFRNPVHRSLPVYGDERVAKYLLSGRYVPSNFDGVLIGSSVSANWNVAAMGTVRLYNESVNGGNAVEEKAILDRVVNGAGTRLAVLIVHPYITASHQFKTVELSPRVVWGALGSQNLLDAYKNALNIRLGRESQTFDAAGTEDFGNVPHQLNSDLQALFASPDEFPVDGIALQAYRDMVTELHARNIPLAFVVPPTAESLFRPRRDAFVRYSQQVLACRLPTDPVLDFLTDEFADLRKDESLFLDGAHVRTSASGRVTAVLDARIRTWMNEGWLRR